MRGIELAAGTNDASLGPALGRDLRLEERNCGMLEASARGVLVRRGGALSAPQDTVRRADAAIPGAEPTVAALKEVSGSEQQLLASYRRLADVVHELLSHTVLDRLLDRVADALAELVPYDALTIYEADVAAERLIPVLSRDSWADEILMGSVPFGEGITGYAVANAEALLVNEAHRDPRAQNVPGTPEDEPEALISVPLFAHGVVKGALNVYRLGDDARFGQIDLELACRFADVAALAIENAHVRARLERQARTDSLTGLLNHRFFLERLTSELARAARANDDASLLVLDLDDFKEINECHGHAAGDDVLVAVAGCIQRTIREADVAGRIGGEEFAVLLPSTSLEDATTLAQRLHACLTSIEYARGERVAVSVGVATQRGNPDDLSALLRLADVGMRTAKVRGKNHVAVIPTPAAVESGA